ncbi:VWA domain-containing protein [Clostridium sp.]
MKKAKKLGKIYSQGWFERKSRRFMSVLLCTSMLSTSVANTAAFAAATSEGGDERQEFSLEKEVVRQAIRDAAKKGKTVKEDAFTFSGDEAETYEGLFEEGNLYELHPDFEKKNDRLNLKMYARLEDEEDMDQYTISGNEEIIFLMTNSSSKERTGRILVDGRASAWMTVAPFGEVKKQVELETEETVPAEIENEVKEPESAVPAESEDITEEDTALGKDVKEQENASGTDNNQIKEETSDPEKQEETEQKDQKPNTGDSEDTSDIKEEPEAADDKKDLSEPDSENENEKADMDASETDTSDADTFDSENDSVQDEDSVQVSRSAHFSMFLTSAAMASPPDAKEEEENDESEENKAIVGDEAEEDNFECILGDSYETVGIKNASAAAFVTSTMELGLTDVAVLSAEEVEEIPHWQISKSKKATNLDENFESQVTLSLPSAEEKLENDIVFVLDKSTSVQLENEALEMLRELQAQAKENGAKVKVGVVIFNKEAHKSDFMDLETQYDAIEAAIRENISSGTNLSAGILAGKKMLDKDTQVAAGRKSLVLLSDGITYIFGEKPTAVAWGFENDGSEHSWAGPDHWVLKYGNNEALSKDEWNERLGTIKAQMDVQGDGFDHPYEQGVDLTPCTPPGEGKQYANSVDKALYLSYEAYLEAAKEQYHCYAMPIGSSAGKSYPWGPSFVKYLADGKTVSFEDIKNDILYAVDRGSTVEDYMGWVKDDYNFDLKSIDRLTVGGRELSKWKDGNTVYFGNEDVNADQYRFKAEYDPSDKEGGEHFVWTMNEAVKNNEPVQLTYTVKLVNPKNNPGESYGQYDEDGSEEYDGLYTNQKAVLHPVGSDQEKGKTEVFPKPTVSYTVQGGELPTIPEGGTSKSKTAEQLDENFKSQVTLSLPSAEEQLVSDVVLVLDKSTSMELKEQALEMLQNLKEEVQEKGAKVKVGVVLFNREAHTDGFMDLETQYEAIKAAIRQEIKSGTNLHAGILAGKSMLDQDTGVADERKTLIVVSDGITYMFNENPTAVAWGFMADSPKHFAGPDNWNSKYGNNQAPADWNAWLTGIGARLSEQKDTHDYPYGTEPDASLITPVEEAGNYVNSIDKALYLSYEAYAQAASEGYHCYAMPITPLGTASNYEWGMSFMRYLANGKQVSFDSIENDILYVVDKGSVVKDYMGYVKEDYNFDFDHIDQLTVGGKALAMYQDGNTWYFGDGEPRPQNYRFKVVYDAGNKAETEMFTWYIEEPVSNFAPVQLTYTVKLINPKTADGTYGKYDRDGSQHYEGLYTNQEAVLYPVDSHGNEYRPEEFPKPTVSYVVEHGTPEPDPTPTPNPDNNGGGSHGGHGGGGGSSRRGSSTTSSSGPAAQPTEPVAPVIPEPQPVVPAEGLPKTGDTDRMDVPMALLAVGMMAAAYVLITGRKKTEE